MLEIPIDVELLRKVTNLRRCWISSINLCDLFVGATALVNKLAGMFSHNRSICDSLRRTSAALEFGL